MSKNTYYYHYQQRPKTRRKFPWVSLIIIGLLVFASFRFAIGGSKPSFDQVVVNQFESIETEGEVNIKWPKEGQSAVGALGYGVLASSRQTPRSVPMASLTKLVTALSVLEKHPLEVGQPGPDIIFDSVDESFYEKYLIKDGTVTKIVAGQSLSQYQAFQAMLIASSNNVADTVARWAFGSVQAYTDAANQHLSDFGLTDTHIDDASGFSPRTISTAEDLVKIGELVLQNPVLAEITSTWQVTLPEAGRITNTNNFLDFEGNSVIGLKTGFTDEAGGTYLSAARYILNGQEIIVIAASLGGKSHFTNQASTMPLLTRTRDLFEAEIALMSGERLGFYQQNQHFRDVVSTEDLQLLTWPNQLFEIVVNLSESPDSLEPGAEVGQIYTSVDGSIINSVSAIIQP